MKQLAIFFLIALCSCSNKTYKSFDYNRSDNPWSHAFKDRVFFSSIKEAYKRDTSIFKHIEQIDALNPYDGLTLQEMKVADEIGVALIQKMPAPAMCEGCLTGMNYFMATALHFYNSKEIDIKTKQLYKKHKKSDLGSNR
jgi:hypothetical protein